MCASTDSLPLFSYWEHAHRIAQTLIKAYAKVLGQPEFFFAEATTDPVAIIRSLHYPPQVKDKTDEALNAEQKLRVGAGAQ